MNVPRWWVFPCNVERGHDDNDKPQIDYDGRHTFQHTFEKAYQQARHYVDKSGYDLAAIMEYVDGKGLELNCTYGYRPAKHEYDLPGPRADGWLLVKKWSESVLASVESTPTKE